MRQVTLTNVNQLVDFTHITQYITISYHNENVSHQYFGNFNESTDLMNDDVIIKVFDVESVRIGHSQDENSILNFVMTSSYPTRMYGTEAVPLVNRRSSVTLAFREISEDMRFDVITYDTATILVQYQKYVHKTDQDNNTNTNNTNNTNNQQDVEEELVNNA
jgi:hypothetical protein